MQLGKYKSNFRTSENLLNSSVKMQDMYAFSDLADKEKVPLVRALVDQYDRSYEQIYAHLNNCVLIIQMLITYKLS